MQPDIMFIGPFVGSELALQADKASVMLHAL